jgi:hypothetical protein
VLKQDYRSSSTNIAGLFFNSIENEKSRVKVKPTYDEEIRDLSREKVKDPEIGYFEEQC